jgi:methenyltetrahydromethanopterin cyclohydrolase
MRAACATEELFGRLGYHEEQDSAVGVLETAQLPDAAVAEMISEKTGVPLSRLVLLAARTSSQAGNLQIVARSIETALHKLFELGFDVNRIRSAQGSAPLSPVADNDLTSIGRTNDAILYGGRVSLMVVGDDKSLLEIGPQVPASASKDYGKPFLNIFEEAGRDFYKIDPLLFSPAELVFQNLDSGAVHHFGAIDHQIVSQSFGI